MTTYRADFQSLADFAEACERLPKTTRVARRSDGAQREWTGESWSESIRYCRQNGTEANVPAAEELIDRIQASLPETVSRQWTTDHAGAFPCVPAFIAGEPENMWTLSDAPAESSPVRIFICTTSSAAVSHEDLLRRGCACLALVLLASRTRPVELYTYTALDARHRRGDSVIVLRLHSHPMMLSEVSYVLTSAGFDRNLTHAYAEHHWRYSGGWSESAETDNYRAGPAQRRMLGLEEQDVLIGPAHCNDPAVNDPIGFVNGELARLGLTQE